MFSLEFFLTAAGLIWGYATFWYILSLIIQRNDVADVAWGLGYVLLAIWLLMTAPISDRLLLVCSLVILWGVRLGLHIGSRNLRKKEDPRYAQWRQDWGSIFYIRSYLQIYLLQGFLLLLVASGMLIVGASSAFQSPLQALDFIGLGVWIFGFWWEVVGDLQLRAFLKVKKPGQILDTGLWSYSRHPNYFGEVTLWWGLFLIVASSPGGIPWGLISPLTITALILLVSGIPMLEWRYRDNEAYQAYKLRTSPFIPMPPKPLPSSQK